MARLTYQAPGVYVEEVPSARQPIAGVGTNTTAFIGIVGDVIYYPVPNSDYDPVAAGAAIRRMLSLTEQQRLLASGTPEDKERSASLEPDIKRDEDSLKKLIAEIDAELQGLGEKLRSAAEDIENANKAIIAADDEVKKQGDLVEGEPQQKTRDRRKAQSTAARKREDLRDAEKRQQDLTAEEKGKGESRAGLVEELERVPTGAPQNRTEEYVEKEDEEYVDADPATYSDLLKKSVLRPYVLVPFVVKPEPLDTKFCTNFTEYTMTFGPFSAFRPEPEAGSKGSNPDRWRFKPIHPGHHALTHAVNAFFDNGGTRCFVMRVRSANEIDFKAITKMIGSIDEVAIITAPGLPKNSGIWEGLITHSETHQNVFAILDSTEVANNSQTNEFAIQDFMQNVPRSSKNAAFYFPYVEVVDPAKQLQDGDPVRRVSPKYRGRTYVPPSGHLAGIYARTDEERGVHKAPANTVMRGAIEVKYYVSKPMQELLNPPGINAIRIMSGAVTVWGARTIGGDRNGEWKYIPVRRLFLFLQESIDEGTQWVVFEPNDPALWDKIRLNISSFLTNVWRSGALFGLTPEEAFYVKCDAELNPPEVRDLGQVITEIGVAIIRPAEFVIFRIAQMSGVQKS